MDIDLKQFYNINEDFKVYVDKLMRAYNWTIDRALESPITVEYYKYLIKSAQNKID